MRADAPPAPPNRSDCAPSASNRSVSGDGAAGFGGRRPVRGLPQRLATSPASRRSAGFLASRLFTRSSAPERRERRLRHRRRRRRQVLPQNVGRRARERRRARQQLVQDAAQAVRSDRPSIAGAPDTCSGLMYAKVPTTIAVCRQGLLARARLRIGIGRRGGHARDAKVREQRAAADDEDVFGLDVAMDDAGCVGEREGVRDIRANRRTPLPSSAAARAAGACAASRRARTASRSRGDHRRRRNRTATRCPDATSLAVTVISRSKRSTPMAVEAAWDSTLIATNRSS